MNEIILKGTIQDIQYSHTINGVDYDKANIVISREDGKEDILSLKFKKFNNVYKENDQVELVGNVRSYSQKLGDKNKVQLYVFTYFDEPDQIEQSNIVHIDGRICKLDSLRLTSTGKSNLHFILANNIINDNGSSKLNNYIPTVVFGRLANELSEKLNVSDTVSITGQLHSRTYKKVLEDGSIELRVAHELVATEVTVL